MNKLPIIFSCFLMLPLMAQTAKIPQGTYIGNGKGIKIVLDIQEDDSFHFSYLHGMMEFENDSIVKLNPNKEQNTSSFKLVFTYDKKVALDKIKIKFKNIPYYNFDTFFIGTQNGNADPDYQSIMDLNKSIPETYRDDTTLDTISFEIKRSEFLNLAHEDYNLKTEIARFKIPEEASEIIVNYELNIFLDLNMQGIYNAKKSEIIISENGKNPMSFVLENKKLQEKDTTIKPLDIVVKSNWTVPRKENKTSYNGEVPTEAVPSTENTYKFSHFKSSSLKESLAHISKTPKKFLVVSLDLKNKNRKVIFDAFIKNSEKNLADYMYYGYQETYDHFDYYLATETDKKKLSTYKISSEKELLIFNATGALLYHTSGDLAEKESFFSVYDDIFDELNKSDQKLQFDKTMLNKKATNKEIFTALNGEYDFKFPNEILKTDNYESTPTSTKEILEEQSNPASIDSVNTSDILEAVVDYPSDYYDRIKDKENLYQFKSSYQTVLAKWKDIALQYKKTNTYDSEYIKTFKRELNDYGFSRALLEDKLQIANSTDFEILDYVFANYAAIVKEENTEASSTVSDVKQKLEDEANTIVYEPYSEGIDTVLENYFQRTAKAEYAKSQQELRNNVLRYYKKYMTLRERKSREIYAYLHVLSQNLNVLENQKEYFEVFETYFNKIMSPNKTVIENLDIDYTANIDNESYWPTYKSNFAIDCNQAAWEVVKIGNNNNWIQKAIQWSETSLLVDQDNYYFLDTLARLYYLNGQKEKAIKTQQKAIDLAKDSENSREYMNVLQEMKNGTYTLPVIKE